MTLYAYTLSTAQSESQKIVIAWLQDYNMNSSGGFGKDGRFCFSSLLQLCRISCTACAVHVQVTAPPNLNLIQFTFMVSACRCLNLDHTLTILSRRRNCPLFAASPPLFIFVMKIPWHQIEENTTHVHFIGITGRRSHRGRLQNSG